MTEDLEREVCQECGRPFEEHVASEDFYGRDIYLCPSDDSMRTEGTGR